MLCRRPRQVDNSRARPVVLLVRGYITMPAAHGLKLSDLHSRLLQRNINAFNVRSVRFFFATPAYLGNGLATEKVCFSVARCCQAIAEVSALVSNIEGFRLECAGMCHPVKRNPPLFPRRIFLCGRTLCVGPFQVLWSCQSIGPSNVRLSPWLVRMAAPPPF